MFRSNNLKKSIAALVLVVFVMEALAVPLPVHAQQQSSGATAAYATLGAVAAAALAWCFYQQTQSAKVAGSGSEKLVDCAITNPGGFELFSMDGLKKFILDPAARLAVRVLLQATTQQIVAWIQGDSGKNVGYVANLEAALRRELDIRGGEFLNQLTGINLCGNIGAFLQITLRTPGLRQRLACTVTDIVANLNNFYRNFEEGGWPAFIRISLEPQNNPYGAYLIALDAKIEAESSRQIGFLEPLRKSFPFEGFKVPKSNCDPVFQAARGAEGQVVERGIEGEITSVRVTLADEIQRVRGQVRSTDPAAQVTYDPDLNEIVARHSGTGEVILRVPSRAGEFASPNAAISSAGEDIAAVRSKLEQRCTTEYEIKTPGALIADGLSKATFIGLDFSVMAKEFDEAIAVIINAAIKKIIQTSFLSDSGGVSRGGQGIFDPGFSNLPKEDITQNVISQQADGAFYQVDAVLAALDAKIQKDRQELFSERQKSSESKDESKIANLEALISADLGRKKQVLLSQFDLIILRRSMRDVKDPFEISLLGQRLPLAILDLTNASQGVENIPSVYIPSGDLKSDTLETLRATEGHLKRTVTLLDETVKEIDRVISVTSDSSRRSDLTARRNAALTQKTLLEGQLNPILGLQATVIGTTNQDRIRDISRELPNRLITINIILDQTIDVIAQIDSVLKQ